MTNKTTFSKLFEEDFIKYGYITEENFSLYLAKCSEFAAKQLSQKQKLSGFESYLDSLNVDMVKVELKDSAELLTQAVDKIQNKLGSLPFVPMTDGFVPESIPVDGSFELNGKHVSPFGYDMVTALYNTYLFPKMGEYETLRTYEFSKNQRATFVYAMDKVSVDNNIPRFTYFTGEFILSRGIFMASQLLKTPKLHAWRVKVLRVLLTDYLAGKMIKLPAIVEKIA
ncbi:MAG: hypothetical protein WC775_00770 [Patescibacteria group bacterium]|jgi:hypothetical protein